MSLAISSILCVILINLVMVLQEKRLRRLAAARLELARTVTEMERLMLVGHIRQGNILHDEFYPKMLNSQYTTNYGIRWKFWNMPPKTKEIRAKLSAEIASKSELGHVLWAFAKADFKEFRNRHPFKSLAFGAWVLFCAGGLVVLLGGLLSVVAILQIKKTLRDRSARFKLLVAEWYASYGLTASA